MYCSIVSQSKERLIASLKEGTVGDGGSSEQIVSSAELEQCKQERDMYKEEVHQNRMTLETLRTEIQV